MWKLAAEFPAEPTPVATVRRPTSRKAREAGHPVFPLCQHETASTLYLPAGDGGHPPPRSGNGAWE